MLNEVNMGWGKYLLREFQKFPEFWVELLMEIVADFPQVGYLDWIFSKVAFSKKAQNQITVNQSKPSMSKLGPIKYSNIFRNT